MDVYLLCHTFNCKEPNCKEPENVRRYKVGAPLLQLVELDKFVITRGYPIRYYKVKTDFALLAKKRWISGDSIASLAKHFEVHEDTIKGYLRLLKDRKKLLSLGFSEGEIQILYEGKNKERNNEGLMLSSV